MNCRRAQTQLLAVLVSKLENPPLNAAFLGFALNGRKILAVGDDLGRYRSLPAGGFFRLLATRRISRSLSHVPIVFPSLIDICWAAKFRPHRSLLDNQELKDAGRPHHWPLNGGDALR